MVKPVFIKCKIKYAETDKKTGVEKNVRYENSLLNLALIEEISVNGENVKLTFPDGHLIAVPTKGETRAIDGILKQLEILEAVVPRDSKTN